MPITLNGDTGIVSPAIDVTTPITVEDGGTGLSSVGTTGNVLTSNGTAWVSSAPPASGVTSLNGQTGTITNTDYGAIGSYVAAAENNFAANQNNAINGTVAGSTLIRSTETLITGNISAINCSQTFGRVSSAAFVSLGLSGTWRRLGASATGPSATTLAPLNLFVRIS